MPEWTQGRRLAAKLARMPLAEVVGRSGQLVRRTASRYGIRSSLRPADAAALGRRVVAPGLIAPRETAACARAVDPTSTNAVLTLAEAIHDGRFEILGHGLLSFGAPVDWHLDPLHDRRSSSVHFSRIDPLDVDVVGDHKVVWELNRHAWLVTLAQAQALTADDRHARRAAALLEHWLDANPPGVGINWASSLEVAMRLIAWLHAWPILRPSFDERLARRWCASAAAHAGYLRAYPSYYFSPNTHLTGEALALRLFGLALPEARHAGRSRRLGERILEQEFARQLRADGFHYEQSACYHRYTVEFLLADALASALNDWSAGDHRRRRLESAIDAMLPLVRPDGILVNTGDEDGGQMLRLGTRDPLDARPLLAMAALVLERPDLKTVVGVLPAEAVWLLGPRAPERYEALEGVGAPPLARVLPATGYAAVRSGWGAGADHVVLDAGPHGTRRCGFGHAHDDALAVAITAAGRPIIIDPGTGSYSDPAVREVLRSTFAHSTLWVDGQPHNRAGLPFEWLTSSHGSLDGWITARSGSLLDATRRLTIAGAKPAEHRRRVFYRPSSGWIIWDRVMGEGDHEIAIQWVLDSGAGDWALTDGGVASVSGSLGVATPTTPPGGICRQLVPLSQSPRYGRIERTVAYRCAFRATLPAQVVTLVRGALAAPPALVTCRGSGGETSPADHLCVRELASRDVILLRGSRASTVVACGAAATDGLAAWLAADDSGVVLGGRRVEIGRRTLSPSTDTLHWSFDAHGACGLEDIEEWWRS